MANNHESIPYTTLISKKTLILLSSQKSTEYITKVTTISPKNRLNDILYTILIQIHAKKRAQNEYPYIFFVSLSQHICKIIKLL